MPTLVESAEAVRWVTWDEFLELERSIRDRMGPFVRNDEYTDAELIHALESLDFFGEYSDDYIVKELVHRGLATYEEALMPDYKYGRVTEQGRDFVLDWRERNADFLAEEAEREEAKFS